MKTLILTMQDLRKMNIDQLCYVQSRFDSGVEKNAEGTPAECFMAGWVNAMDTNDEQHGQLDSEEFSNYCLHNLINMHGDDAEISINTDCQ